MKEKDVKIAQSQEGAQKAELEAHVAQKQTAEAREEAAKANEEAARANESAEAERVEQLRLEAQIAPRRLTIDQVKVISEACRSFKGHSVTVSSYSLDAEGAILAKQLVTSFTAAGMQVRDGTASSAPIGGFSLGVHVSGTNARIAAEIRTALSMLGHLAVAPSDSATQPGGWEMRVGPSDASDVTILVGVKPVT